mgnify:CR=1 FL=1
MDNAELSALRERAEKIVREEMEKQLTKARIEAINKDLDITIRELAKEVIAKHKVEFEYKKPEFPLVKIEQ